MGEVVLALRQAAFERQTDVQAVVSAPPGRHELRLVARPGGHVVFAVRFDELTNSRRNVMAEALARRGWDPDEDGEGATHRYPPGTDYTTVAFDGLAVLTLGGAPASPRTVEARDAAGEPVELG